MNLGSSGMNQYKSIMFADGCFWCMAKPYYEYDGVISVFSGYAGGLEVNPTYEEVKAHKTTHRETIKIVYDPNVISYDELLDIYFDTIDPFDGEGQFIDRGFNYTCAVFTSVEEEKNKVRKRLQKLEAEYKTPTYVQVLDEVTFYMAEEYHQDYAIKNPKEMEEELITSGRKKS